MKEMTVILASGSPRRRELLQQIGIDPVIIPSQLAEHPSADTPEGVVKQLSLQKASDIADQVRKYLKKKQKEWGIRMEDSAAMGEETIVLGADTVVSVDDRILGKPEDHDDAARMIRMLEGRIHSVYTGVTLIRLSDSRIVTFAEETRVHVYPMSEEEILQYADSEEPMDKAGAYGIQGKFAAYIEGIEGDYNNVVGLPVGRVYQEWKKLMDSVEDEEPAGKETEVMCKAAEEWKEELLAQGRAEGEIKGRAEARAKAIAEGMKEATLLAYRNCMNRGMSQQDAIAISGITSELLSTISE